MSDRPATPWHLWVVGVVTFLWNCGGVFDYVMSVTRNADYLAQMSEPQLALLTAAPVWATAAFAVGTWTSLIGSLLLRSRLAVPAFALSLVGAVVSLLYGQVIDKAPAPPPELAAMAYMPYVIAVIAAGLAWYAWTMSKTGVLR